MSRLCNTHAIVIVAIMLSWTDTRARADTPLSHGRQIILDKGIQVATWVFAGDPHFNRELFADAHYTTPDTYIYPSDLDAMPGTLFGAYRLRAPGVEQYLPYASRMTMLNYEDEPGPYVHPGEVPLLNPARLAEVRDFYSRWRTAFPNALMHLSTVGLQEYTDQDASVKPGDEAGLRTYMQQTTPDLLMYDKYPSYSFTPADRNTYYSNMAVFRKVASEGYDGTGAQPICYGQFTRMYRKKWSDDLPSESFVRMQRYTSLGFGFTVLSDFSYNIISDNPADLVHPVTFDSNWAPTAAYNYVAAANTQIGNLSPALSRLANTDVRVIPATTGTHQDTYWDSTPPFVHTRTVDDDLQSPDGVEVWSRGTAHTGGYTDYITGITPLGRDNGASHVHSDVIIGYFAPLRSNNIHCTFANGLHFMVVNGAAGTGIPVDANGVADPTAMAASSAATLAEQYRLTFDFTGSAFNSLVRLSRDTGEVELVTLASLGNSRYSLDLYLEGGTGDLFAFWNSSNPLPSVPEPGALGLLGTGLLGGLACMWRKGR